MRVPLFILGLDGMSGEMLDELIDRGLLKSGSRFREQAAERTLLSTVPSYTIPGWASAFTGVLPGAHGLLWWRAEGPSLPWFDQVRTRFVSLDEARRPTLWAMASASGTRVGIVDVPATFPAPEVNGVAVSGFLAPWPHRRVVTPPSLAEEVLRWLPPESPAAHSDEAAKAASVEEMTRAARERLSFSRGLVREGYELVIHVLVGPDRLSHMSWFRSIPDVPGSNELDRAIKGYWRLVDEAFRLALDVLDAGGSVIVCSDHGSEAPPPMTFFTRSWLSREGLIPRTLTGRALPSWSHPLLRAVRGPARRVRNRLGTSRPGSSFGIAGSRGSIVDVSLGDREVGFFVHPGVEASDRVAMTSDLIARLKTVEHEGEPVFAAIGRGETFVGPITEGTLAPDVIAVSSSHYRVTPGSVLSPNEPVTHRSDRGIHRREGVLLVAGASLEEGAVAGVEDVAPTALGILGLDAPHWTVGRSRLVREARARQVPALAHAAAPQPALASEDLESIEQHLRELGYLE
jgi:predicted AlkP superfamily phosphohydrolase/phosphomutase